jgi:hypothetical protein
MKTYNLLGRKVYIEPTIKHPYKNTGGNMLPYKSKPYFVKYMDDNSLAIDGRFYSVNDAKESIEFRNKMGA